MCCLYGLILIFAIPLQVLGMAIGGIVADEFHTDNTGSGVFLAYSVLMLVGLLSSMVLLLRYVSGGPSALSATSRLYWICAAGTLSASILLLIQLLMQRYLPGAVQPDEINYSGISMYLCPPGILYPYLLFLRHSFDRS